MNSCCRRSLVLLLLLSIASFPVIAEPVDSRGAQFMGFTGFSRFDKRPGTNEAETVWISPVLQAQIPWNELVVSWNAEATAGAYLRIEARAYRLGQFSPFYTLGLWSPNPQRHPRESVLNQKDQSGDVSTDTLILRERWQGVQVRLVLGADDLLKPKLKFLGLSLMDNSVSPAELPPNHAAWGKLISVPERSQMAYPNGNVLCSPTTISMIMSYWASQLQRPDIDRDVPEIATAVYDRNWKGTGNWPFNTAYAGAYPGLRAYVARMTDLSEVEDWIAAGIPVGLSICYDRLRGRAPGPNGHLVVCVGFTETGDPILNDPGTRENVRKVFPRKNLAFAWAYSKNAAYLVYPEAASVPKDRFGHWYSWSSTRRIRAD